MRYQLTGKEIALLRAVMGGRIPYIALGDVDIRFDNSAQIENELKLFHGKHREWLSYDTGAPVFDFEFKKTMMLCFNADREIKLDNKEDEYFYGYTNQYMSVKSHGPDTFYCEYYATIEDFQLNFYRFLGIRYQQNKFPVTPFRLILAKKWFDLLVKWHSKGDLKKIEKLCLKQGKNYDICLQILNDIKEVSCLTIVSTKVDTYESIRTNVFFDPMGVVRLTKRIGSKYQEQYILMQAETSQLPQISSHFEGNAHRIKQRAGFPKVISICIFVFLILVGLIKFIASIDTDDEISSSSISSGLPASNTTKEELMDIKAILATANQKILYPSQLGNYELFSESVSYRSGLDFTDLEIKYAFVNSKPSTPEYINYSCAKRTDPYALETKDLIDIQLTNGIHGYMDKGSYMTFDEAGFQCSLSPYKSSKEDVIAFAETLTNKAHIVENAIDLNQVTILKLPKEFTSDFYSTITFSNWYRSESKEANSEVSIYQSESSASLSLSYTIADKLGSELTDERVSKKKSVNDITVYTLKSKEVYFQKNNLHYYLSESPDLDLIKIIRSST
ncbi:hypothetical protein EHS13_34000 [Paenibacillus psychroresistens]|uniref:Uncharacterized protein n=1 Tax=Paenibacillus psychroresistens TaxID=1778678 RepID=A0A6B8RWQ8_9BACL|nr:hypothetical protein [Paenibacillus psychroresistens]QGQ99518.1 hypothetical protein EHS13_34000 [Paenibacillus psychroresistens]